ncbi:MAG: BTAD domain-containing putative transcriptional regulator [Anaerolineae bacterium]
METNSTHNEPQLQINCFGNPQILLDGKPVEQFRSSKARGLLLYLAATGRDHSRASLVGLFWGDLTEENGSANLRKTLTNLRKLVEPYLNISRESIGINWAKNVETDVRSFDKAQALGLVRGDFLEGFYIRGCAEFETWTLTERYRLKEKYLQLLRINIEESQSAGDLNQAIQHALNLVAQDPLQEASHRALMHLYAQSDQRKSALSQFDKLARLLAEELDVEPEETTVALHQSILAGEVSIQPTAERANPLEQADRKNLLLLGRKVERYWFDTVLAAVGRYAPPAQIDWQPTRNTISHPWPEMPNDDLEKQAHLADEFEAADRALLIQGEPGSGKTVSLLTLARDLFEAFANGQSDQIPVVLLLPSWAEKRRPLAEWVVEQLNSRYQIPPRLGGRWLAQNRLILMLDGLDEVQPIFQQSCLSAINQFRADYGLTGITVCCRLGVLRSFEQRPMLSGAITLQPISDEVASSYLIERGVKQAVDRPELLELAQSPLMLQVIAQAGGSLNTGAISPNTLFQAFIDQSFKTQSETDELERKEIESLLGWLAQQLQARSQSVFYIEDLQPDWITGRRNRLIYLLLTRILIGGWLGIGIALLYFAGTLNQPEFKFQMFLKFGELLPVPAASRDLWAFMLIIQAHGIFAAFWHFFCFNRWEKTAIKDRHPGRQRALLIGGQIVFSLSYVIGLAVPFDPLGPAFFSAILFVYFLILGYGLWGYSRGYESDIRPSSALSWSWWGAGIGAGFGLFLVATFYYVGADPSYLPMAFTAAVVTGGLRRNRLEETIRPNQGIWLTARNSLLGGLIQAVLPALFIGWQAPLGLTLLISGASALLGWMVFGGAILIKHTAVRYLIRQEANLPWQAAKYFGQIGRLSLIQQVGSGYIFFHQKLLDHFATYKK